MSADILSKLSDLRRIELDRDQLIRILHECYQAGGNSFPSMEADVMFRERFCDWGESPTQFFKNNLK